VKLLSLSAESDAEPKEFVKVIESDPGFSAKVLHMANSPLFGFTSNVYALNHAIALMGLERLKSLVVTAGMQAYITSNRCSLALRQTWTHSLACALLCRELAPFFHVAEAPAYSVGLMHDIGRLGLAKSYPDDYERVAGQSYEHNSEIIQVEDKALGLDHCQAGYWLTRTWGFPAAFSKICTHHHDPVDVRQPELLQVVQVSCRLADCLGFPAIRCNHVPSYREIMSATPGFPANDPKWSVEQLQETIAEKLRSAEQQDR
jgi:HD-like signal output (HDOD) protein